MAADYLVEGEQTPRLVVIGPGEFVERPAVALVVAIPREQSDAEAGVGLGRLAGRLGGERLLVAFAVMDHCFFLLAGSAGGVSSAIGVGKGSTSGAPSALSAVPF